MGFQMSTCWLSLVPIICLFQVTWSRTIIEIKFLKYEDRCREDAGMSKCDPKFKFCVDRPRKTLSVHSCSYASTGESGYFQNVNFINFSYMTNIKGIPNPWIIQTNQLMDPSISFVVQVRDDDLLGADDHLQTWAITLTEIVHPSKNVAPWSSRSMSSSSHSLHFQIRMYCDAGYYNPNCTEHCIASDSQTGHYTCDPNNGNKVCMQGWTGSDCTEDVNECLLNYCERGNCENLQGDYVCHCPPHYTGKNCTVLVNLCDSTPCYNNASCMNMQDFSYNCSCVGEWEGQHCNITLNPCKSAPCQNGAACTPSDDHTSFICDCVYPYSGIRCDTINPTAMSTIASTKETAAVQSANKAGLAEGMTNTKEAINSETEGAGIQHWHVILIAVLVLVVITLIIIFLVVRKRQRTQKLLTDNTIVVYHNNNNSAFENNVYSDVSINALETKERQKQLTPLPSTPTEDDQFMPMKPLFTPMDVDVQGAEGGIYSDLTSDMDADGYVKPSNCKNNCYTKMTEKPQRSEQAERNHYSDFSSLKQKQEKHESVDEVHYHDLDEMALAIKGFKNAMKEKELKLQTDGSLRVVEGAGDETAYTDFPSNIPVECGHYGNVPASSCEGEVSDDPFVSLNMAPNSLETHECQYDIPPNNLPASTNNNSDSAKPFESSTIACPVFKNPAYVPKSFITSSLNKTNVEETENTEQNRQESKCGFPLPPLVSPGHVDHSTNIKSHLDDEDYLLPVSFKERYTCEDSVKKSASREGGNDIQGITSSNPNQAVYPDNFWFSES